MSYCCAGQLCDCEKVSHHYDGHGLGIVVDLEVIIFVVFDTRLQVGDKLTSDCFMAKRLSKGEISLARKAYTTLNDIDDFVLSPAKARGETAVGASVIEAKTIRHIVVALDDGHQKRNVRGACVLDKVDLEDHNSHAALKGCTKYGAISDKQLGKLRLQFASDLAKKFGPIQHLQSIF